MMRVQAGGSALRRSFRTLLTMGGVWMCFVGPASADDDDIVNAGGFEPPFSIGQLEGQVNPPGEGQVIPPGQWQRTPGGTSTAVVQTAVFAPGGGNQAVRVNRAANNEVRWAVQVDHLGYPDYPNPFPPESAQPCICINWDMRVEQTSGPLQTFGPFFGVEAYEDSGNAFGLLGSLGVDATTGDILYQATGTGFFTETGSKINFGAWNHFQIKLDYSTDQYTIFRNFAMLGTFGFVDPGLDQFSDADIAAISVAGDAASQALTGTAYFDNFLVREGACPIDAPGLLGDYNGNGVVDAADYPVWRDTFGATVAAGSGADGDGDGVIDPGDYAVWKTNFGAGAGSSSTPTGATSAVPEPSATAVFAGLFLAGIVMDIRRRYSAIKAARR